LQDTLLDIEDSDEGMLWPHLRETSGGEDLGGETAVGWTMELQNAQLAFEPRTTSDSSGTVTTPDVNGITLIDGAADFISDGIVAGDTILNQTDGSVSSVISVDNLNTITCYPLTDGSDNQWDSSDSYKIWNKVSCEISGGNLVAVNDVGNTIVPTLPTFATHVLRTSSSSATLSEQSALQYSSFEGGIWIDAVGGEDGTEFPYGTPQEPVKTLATAMTILNARGFSTIYVLGDLTINSGDAYTGINFIGESISKSTITVDSDAEVTNCEFYEATVTGTLDGNCKIKNCQVLDLNYVYGIIELCMLGPGTITLAGSNPAHFLDCWSGVTGSGTPIIDGGGSGQELGVRNYNGGLKLINKNGTDSASFDINSGNIILDTTVTNGDIVIRGIGTFTDDSTGSAVVNTDGLMSKRTITKITWEAVCIDVNNGSSGTTFPLGTESNPVDNEADAYAIAIANNIRKYHLRGMLTLARTYADWTFLGEGAVSSDIVVLNSQTCTRVRFEKVTITGVHTANSCQYYESLLSNVSGLDGIMYECGLSETITMGGAGSSILGKSISMASTPTIIDLVGADRIAKISCHGDLQINNVAAGSPAGYIQVGISYGRVTLDSTCTGGTAYIHGNGLMTDNSTGTVVTDDTTGVSPGAVAAAVWDEPTADHVAAGTFGEKIGKKLLTFAKWIGLK